MDSYINKDALLKGLTQDAPKDIHAYIKAFQEADVRENIRSKKLVGGQWGYTHWFMCEHCGKPVSPLAKYCDSCGAELICTEESLNALHTHEGDRR